MSSRLLFSCIGRHLLHMAMAQALRGTATCTWWTLGLYLCTQVTMDHAEQLCEQAEHSDNRAVV